jgi:hypothetical protein
MYSTRSSVVLSTDYVLLDTFRGMIPSSLPSPLSGLKAWKAFAGVLILNALLVFPVLYQTYKHFGETLTPWDIEENLALADRGPGELEAPFRYRVLAPLAVKAMRVLPGYGIEIDFQGDAQAKEDFFHFLVLNFGITVLTSGLLFLYLLRYARPAFAYAGSLLYLFSFYVVAVNYLPMSDAACHLAIMGAVLCFEHRRFWAMALVSLVGVFAKETVLIVMAAWICMSVFSDKRRLVYLAALVPAAAAYIVFTRLSPPPAVTESITGIEYYEPGYVLRNLAGFLNPALYDRSFLFHTLLANLPFLAAAVAYAGLRLRGRKIAVNPELAVFFFLLWLGVTLGIGNNAGRVAYMAFPAIVLFKVRVLEALGGSRFS